MGVGAKNQSSQQALSSRGVLAPMPEFESGSSSGSSILTRYTYPKLPLQVAILAALYFAAGWAGFLLAVPPVYATPVWPAAGVALLGILHFGYRAWVGVLIGSVLVVLFVALGPSADSGLLALTVSTVSIGLGVAAQAVAGAWLIRRYVGFPSPLLHAGEILRFMILGGPLSCLIAATWGVTTLRLAGQMSAADVAFNWWTWWAGDSIGVMLVAPIALAFIGSPPEVWRARRVSVAFPLFLTMLAVMVLYAYVHQRERARIQSEFHQRVTMLEQAWRHTLSHHEETLFSVGQLYAAGEQMTRRDFRNIVARPLAMSPGVRAFAWCPSTVSPDGAERVRLLHVEPEQPHVDLLGYDLTAQAGLIAALTRARDQGIPVAAAPTSLLPGAEEATDVAVFVPVYGESGVPEASADKRVRPLGYVMAILQADVMLETTLAPLGLAHVVVTVTDTDAKNGGMVLARQGIDSSGVVIAGADTMPSWATVVDMAGRPWKLSVDAGEAYTLSHRSWAAWLVLGGSFLFMSGLGGLLLALTGGTYTNRRRADALAVSETRLRESEAKLRAFLESAVGFAVYRVRVKGSERLGGKVEFASPSIKDVLDVDPDAEFDQWFANIHEDDLPRVMAANERAWRNGTTFDTTMRVLHSGRKGWRWIRAISHPVVSAGGDITHFNGLMIDVTDRIESSIAVQEERDFSDAVMDTVGALVVVLDKEGRIVRFNRACEECTGYKFEEAVGRFVWDFLLLPEESAGVHDVFESFHAGDFPNKHENHWLTRNGEKRLIAWSNTALLDADGKVDYAIATGIDITERKQAELALRKLSSAVEQSGSAVIITDRDGMVEYVNPRYTEITGYDASQVLGTTAAVLADPGTEREPQASIWQTLLLGQDWRGELRDTRRDADDYWAYTAISPIKDVNGEISHFAAVIEDITALRNARREMERLASFDVLTNLPNRRLFRDRLEQALKLTRRREQPLALLYLDLDNFKRVNDSLGHDAGDNLLCTVATRVSACVREADTVGRLGGDEFVLLLQDLEGREGAETVASNVLNSLRKPIVLGSQSVVVTGSIGITMAPADGMEAAALMKHADLAMYRAKEMGKDNYQFFHEELDQQVSRRMSLEAEMRSALLQDQFLLHFQPVVDLRTLQVVGLEALARWQHPERGLIPPAQFIPVAEETGLIVPLGRALLAVACRVCRRLRREGRPELYVAVNLSVRQFQDPDFIPTLKKVLTETDIQAHSLVLEITESLIMQDVPYTSTLLGDLRELGVHLSIDDFGTGYSSLSYLKQLPVNSLKVDRSFVRDIPHDADDKEITAAVIAMAHKLGLLVVAEGVETESQVEFLRDNQCDLVQGYLFGRPVPEAELDRLLHELDYASAGSQGR